jgi:hypothetical protein
VCPVRATSDRSGATPYAVCLIRIGIWRSIRTRTSVITSCLSYARSFSTSSITRTSHAPYYPTSLLTQRRTGFTQSGLREVSQGNYAITATGDVGLGNPFLGGGAPRGIQLAVKILLLIEVSACAGSPMTLAYICLLALAADITLRLPPRHNKEALCKTAVITSGQSPVGRGML